MLDSIQFEEVKNNFSKFGKFLIIFACAFVIQGIIAIAANILKNYFQLNINNSIIEIIYCVLRTLQLIILILMIYEIKKISNLTKSPKSGIMFAMFLVWLIIYFILDVIFVFLTTMIFLNPSSNITLNILPLLNYSFSAIAIIFQLISWIFMYVFILNTHGLFPDKFKHKFFGYLIVVIISNCIELSWILLFTYIGPGFSYLSLTPSRLTFRYSMITSLDSFAGILLFIGYILLGIHLVKIKSSINQNVDSPENRTESTDMALKIKEDSSNKFSKFGKFLIVFACVFVIQIIIGITLTFIHVTSFIYNSFVLDFNIVYWVLQLVQVILLILMTHEIRKISKLVKGSKAGVMFAMFLVWLIIYWIYLISDLIFVIRTINISYMSSFNKIWLFYTNNIMMFNYVFVILAAIFQILSWLFMYSFILNTHGLFPEKYKHRFLGYLIVLMIFSTLILTWLMSFSYGLGFSYSNFYISGSTLFTFKLLMSNVIVPNLANVLLFIGYILLGNHLVKIKPSITQNNDSTKNRTENTKISIE